MFKVESNLVKFVFLLLVEEWLVLASDNKFEGKWCLIKTFNMP